MKPISLTFNILAYPISEIHGPLISRPCLAQIADNVQTGRAAESCLS